MARSEPQIPDRDGVDVHPVVAGSAGASRSIRRNGPTPAPRPDPKDDTTRAAAKRGSERSKRSVLIAPSPPWAAARRRARAGAGGATRPRPWPSAPRASPAAGRWRRESRLGVDGNREADGLEHGEVTGRVGIGHRLLEGEAVERGVVGQHQGPGFTDGRQRRQVPGQPSVACAPSLRR